MALYGPPLAALWQMLVHKAVTCSREQLRALAQLAGCSAQPALAQFAGWQPYLIQRQYLLVDMQYLQAVEEPTLQVQPDLVADNTTDDESTIDWSRVNPA